MAQKSYRPKEGDVEVMQEDGMSMHVYRKDGQRLTIDMSEDQAPEGEGEAAEVTAVALLPESIVVDNESGEVDDNSPLWTAEIEPVLDRLDGSTLNRADIDQKKKATVLALAWAEYSDESRLAVFKRKDTCNKHIYYRKWSKDALFSSVLADVLDIVRSHKTESELRSIGEAARMIRQAAPAAARDLIKKIDHSNPFVSLQASMKVLGMASTETADKGSLHIRVNAQQIAEEINQAQRELEEWQQQKSDRQDEIQAATE